MSVSSLCSLYLAYRRSTYISGTALLSDSELFFNSITFWHGESVWSAPVNPRCRTCLMQLETHNTPRTTAYRLHRVNIVWRTMSNATNETMDHNTHLMTAQIQLPPWSTCSHNARACKMYKMSSAQHSRITGEAAKALVSRMKLSSIPALNYSTEVLITVSTCCSFEAPRSCEPHCGFIKFLKAQAEVTTSRAHNQETLLDSETKDHTYSF